MNIAKFLREVKVEMKKVTWPTKDSVVKMTSLVIIVSLIVGIYIGIVDVALAKVMEVIVN